MKKDLLGVRLLVAALWAVATLSMSGALAQSSQCVAIRQRIDRLEHQGSGNAAQERQLAARQQEQINRTAAYANSIGCSNRKFLFFGKDPPPQCGAIKARITRMRENLSNIMVHLGAGGDNRMEIGALRGQYAAICLSQPAQSGPGGLLDTLFGHHPAPYNQPQNDNPDLNGGQGAPDTGPLANSPSPANPAIMVPTGPHLGGGMAICVRECDGGFFPVSYSAWHHSVADLQRLCTARCPNAKVDLYSMAMGADIGTARSADGQPYRDLPSAFEFRKTHVPNCGCKPKDESWAQALAKSDAESLLGNEQASDIIVTQKQSDQMGQPVALRPAAVPDQTRARPLKRHLSPAVASKRPLTLAPSSSNGIITSTPLPQPN